MTTRELHVTKAHAYGNDFLLIDEREPLSPEIIRRLCARHTGAGADGVVLFGLNERNATMRLFNADGSPAELSGNGLRCLAALVAQRTRLPESSTVTVETCAGTKSLALLAVAGSRYMFRTALGPPADVRQLDIPVLDETVTASVLSVGNPQCVVLGALPNDRRFNQLGPALSEAACAYAVTTWPTTSAPDRGLALTQTVSVVTSRLEPSVLTASTFICAE